MISRLLRRNSEALCEPVKGHSARWCHSRKSNPRAQRRSKARRRVVDLSDQNGDRMYHLTPKPPMRRLLATIGFLLLAWTIVEPISFAFASSSVPLCCRKNGKHHCMAMSQEDAESRGPSLRPILPTCPYRSRTLAVSSHVQLVPIPIVAPVSLQTQSASSSLAAPRPRSFQGSQLFDRGPPRQLLQLSL